MVGDLPAYPSVDALPEPPDVAWIGLPAAQAADAVLACGRAGVPFAVVLGAGFAETGESGAAEQARLVECARRAGVRLLGPNTVGFVNAWDRVALTFSTVGKLDALAPGPVALLSQSGGLGGCLLDRAADRGLGVGLFVSTGNEADLSLADYLDWLVEDGRARAIACLVEQVRQPDRVAAAVERAAARGIAVVALKLGALPTGSRAARSHTGSLAGGRDAVAGLGAGRGPARGDRARPPRRDGGAPWPGRRPSRGRAWRWRRRRAASRCCSPTRSSRGASPSPRWRGRRCDRVGALLPPYVTVANPLDITAGLPDETFGEVLAAVARDPGIDVVVVPLTMATAGGGATRAAHVVKAGAQGRRSPSWSAGREGGSSARGSGRSTRPACRSSPRCRAAPPRSAPRSRSARSGTRPPARVPPVVAASWRRRRAGPLPWASVHALLGGAGLRMAARGDRPGRRRGPGRGAAPPLSRGGQGARPASPDGGRRRAARRLDPARSWWRRSGTLRAARRGLPGAADGGGAGGAGRRGARPGAGHVRDGRARAACGPSSTASGRWRRPPATRPPPGD